VYLPKTILSLSLACPKAPTLVMELHTWVIWRSRDLSLNTYYRQVAPINTPQGTAISPKGRLTLGTDLGMSLPTSHQVGLCFRNRLGAGFSAVNM
jgi:hypothetical protein